MWILEGCEFLELVMLIIIRIESDLFFVFVMRILEKAQDLKANTGHNKDKLKSIFIKKDMHPNIRKEWKRLYDVYENELKKPENVGRSVTFDKKKRCILIENKVIDTWSNLVF